MPSKTRPHAPWCLVAVVVAASPALAQDTSPATVKTREVTVTNPAAEPTAAPVVIAPHQIDRYEAIRQVRAELKANPDRAADWIILGELAHDVALDLPADQDDAYFTMSRQAYEKALALDPDNAGLQAAVRFARDQEAGASAFDAARVKAASAYVAARRRELARAGAVPTLRYYDTPAVTAAPAPAAAATTTTTTVARPAPGPAVGSVTTASAYRPYIAAPGTPLTYDLYSRSFTVPTGPDIPYVTVRETTTTATRPVNRDEAIRRATGVVPTRP